MQFNVVKYSAGDKCEDVDDPYVQAVFRARRTTPPAAQPEQVVFPTMLRKMWSGGEVQAWLDENVNKEKT
jgi:hypothetical protein